VHKNYCNCVLYKRKYTSVQLIDIDKIVMQGDLTAELYFLRLQTKEL